MKRTKIITLSLLGILLLIPFIRPSRAHGVSPYFVGIEEGDHEEWDFSIYVGAFFETWDTWFDDNMSYYWSEAFGQTTLDNMTSTWELAGKVPTPPQVNFFFDVDSVQIDTGGFDANFDEVVSADETWISPGRTMVTMASTSGSFMDFPGWPYYSYFGEGTAQLISNTTAQFAADLKYGALATSAIWGTNTFNTNNIPPISGPPGIMGDIQTIFFAPNNVNWSEFADECNANLALDVWIASSGDNEIKFNNLSNGFTLTSENGSFDYT